MDKRSEIEAKRAKIAELRRQREARAGLSNNSSPDEKENHLNSTESTSPSSSGSQVKASPGDDHQNIKVNVGLGHSKGDNSGENGLKTEYKESDGTGATENALTDGMATPSAPVAKRLSHVERPLMYSKSTQTENLEPWDLKEKSSEVETVDIAQVHLPEEDSVTTPPEEPQWENGVIPTSDDFLPFIENSWRAIARLLDGVKPTLDYTASNTTKPDARDLEPIIELNGPKAAISAMDWSPHFDDLIAVAYRQTKEIYIWSLSAPSSPEWKLHASTEILNIKFAQNTPHIIYGTGYNGQVLVWDLRKGRVGVHPILKSTADGSGHLYPVYSLQVVGGTLAPMLVTCSTDGTVCTWSPDVLAKPRDKLVLLETTTSVAVASPLAPTSLTVLPNDNSGFIVGTMEGTIYRGHRTDRVGARAGVDANVVFKGHKAPVTSADFRTNSNDPDIGRYLLTGGLDWSICLWYVAESEASGAANVKTPLLEINVDDTVTDLGWCPGHPAIFASISQNQVYIWNLLKDSDDPISTYKAGDQLNKLAWSRNNRLAFGSTNGRVTILEAAPGLLESPEDSLASFKLRYSPN